MARGIALLRARWGLQAVVARELGLTRSAVTKWQRVPAERLLEVERITGIPREQLRPDLYAGRRCTEAA
jgi:DNA-binding transcriptional regulator YdaS (Cro superfamily)